MKFVKNNQEKKEVKGVNNPTSTSGFTLIEMLVVVAVIGILASVLLTTLGPAKNKAKDSRIIQEVNQVRVMAEVVYDGDYGAVEELPRQIIQNSELKLLAEDITEQGGELHIIKSADETVFSAYSKLNALVGVEPDLKVNYYCVDSNGRAVFSTQKPKSYQCPISDD